MSSRSASGTRIWGSRHLLTAIRLLWLLTAATVLVLLVPEIGATFTSIHHLCTSSTCNSPQLPAGAAHTLHTAGISLDAVAVYVIGLALIVVAVCYAVACGLMLRRSADPVLILTAFLCVLLCTPGNLPLVQASGWWGGPSEIVVALASVVGAFYLYLFPSGSFVPRWTVLLAIGFVVVQYLPQSLLPAVGPRCGRFHSGHSRSLQCAAEPCSDRDCEGLLSAPVRCRQSAGGLRGPVPRRDRPQCSASAFAASG